MTGLSGCSKIAIASSFRGRAICYPCITQEHLPRLVLNQLRAHFAFMPSTGGFDSRTVLAEVENASYSELAQVLAEMGYRMTPGSEAFFLDEGLWEQFVDKYLAA